MGSVFYAGGGGAEQDLYAFPMADVLLLPFAGAAAATVAILVRSRVKPFQPTILLDGLIVSLAARRPWWRSRWTPRSCTDVEAAVRPDHAEDRLSARRAVVLLAFACGCWR